MDRLPSYLALLSLLAVVVCGASAAQKSGAPAKAGWQPKQEDYARRVIVSFVDHGSELAQQEFLENEVLHLGAKPGVVQAQALKQLGMAVVTCESMDAEERLVRELEEDPRVELATPDTLVYFDDAALPDVGLSTQADRIPNFRKPAKDLRQCSSQPRCAALNLTGEQGSGNCCPSRDGTMLACCDVTVTQNLVALKSFFGKYVEAEADGTANANGEKIGVQEKFELFHNDDGSVSLRSHYGKYVTAEAWGGVNANRDLIQDWEKFRLIENGDGTVSFLSFHGTYFVAEPDGRLNADRRKISDWEKFTMVYVEGPTQRFPDDTNFTALWGMYNEQDTDIDAPEAWKTFTGEPSAGIVVAVIDTGIDYNHEDLWQNMWTNPGEIPGNGIDDDHNGFIDDVYGADFANEDGDPMDDQRHGTHCAGTIAGIGNNELGVTGVAWRGVRLMALKFLSSTGSGRTSDAVKAIEYAIAHGAKVLSNSWGSGSSSAALRVAITRAEAAGILFVAAAGNSGSDNDKSPHYPSSYQGDGIIAVASTNEAGELSDFSCYGETSVDLAAPGSNIYSTVPDNSYKYLSGTSMATPHVSGLAALIWMYRPKLSMTQVKKVLMKTVDRLSALEGKMTTAGRINAKKALDLAAATEPMYAPIHAPRAIEFKDANPKVGVIGGVVTVTAAANESDVSYYKVYWLSRAGFQLDAVGNVTANGSKFLEVPLPSSMVVPKFAVGFVAVSGNASGEMAARLGSASNVTVKDYGVPEQQALGAEWRGDEDLRSGVVAGTLVVARAADESSITQYNIHWSEGLGSRGPLLGSVPAAGFLAPICVGKTCPLINSTSTIGWHEFSRVDYGDNELATISFTGPGLLVVTRFDTENYYDTLTVGTAELSGQPRVPVNGKLGVGTTSVKWASDDSISAGGWTFEVTQSEARAEFRVEAGRPLGRGVEVVPAYQGTEMASGIFVELADYDSKMPPSPAFAPTAVRFTDTNGGRGVVAGVATVVPSEAALAHSDVTFYRLNFAASDGATIGSGWHLDSNGSSPLSVEIPATELPPKATQLMARAGNSYGLGEGQAVTDIMDFVEGQTHIMAPSPPLETSSDLFAARQPAPQEEEVQPWLPAHRPKEQRRVVWTATPTSQSSPIVTVGRVRSAITVAGLDAELAASPEARKAFRGAVATALPGLGEEDVKIARVLAVSTSAVEPEAGATGVKAEAAVVEFEVDPSQGASAVVLDRIEARLILLSNQGRFAKRFEEALLARIAELGAALPAGASVTVRAPQQLAAAGRHGRQLAASAPEAAVFLSSELRAAWIFRVAVSSALIAVLLVAHKLTKHFAYSRVAADPEHV